MAKYEIMMVVDGRLDEAKAQSAIKELIGIIEKTDQFKFTNLGLKKLAYQINHLNEGWYFQYNFETNVPSIINEFKRLTLINKNVLRHLVINLEKDYGAKAINNPKKQKRSQIKLKKYTERQERIKAEKEAREKEFLAAETKTAL